MSEFKLSILGSGSAMGGINAFHTSQVLSLRNKQFMIDCGEGAQIKLREYGVSVGRMNHIFISHLHGDHCFGLLGLISTLGMTGRKADFTIHAHPDLEKLFAPMFAYFCQDFPFSVHFESFSPYKSEIIYDDKSVVITTLPLKHRVPSSGFLFEEKATERHLNRAMADAYNIPVCKFKNIKAGEDFVTEDGEIIPNERLTTPADKPKKYAYMSDTAYSEQKLELVYGADCLYHEATFLKEDVARSKITLHSSASDAATFAKKAEVKQLIIGHYSSRYRDFSLFLDEAKQIFENTYLALDGKVFLF